MYVTQLLVPGARVYGLTDKIPLHVQLSGSLSSLQKFFLVSPHGPSSCYSEANIRVTVLRVLVLETRGQKTSRSTIVGEGRLSEMPPLDCPPCGSRDIIHLDWEGEVTSNDISVGGFRASNVTVKVGCNPENNSLEA